eukprot:11164255-Lingulodinium_polyedra.AAC.1
MSAATIVMVTTANALATLEQDSHAKYDEYGALLAYGNWRCWSLMNTTLTRVVRRVVGMTMTFWHR